jgi:hypothetical protein
MSSTESSLLKGVVNIIFCECNAYPGASVWMAKKVKHHDMYNDDDHGLICDGEES